MGSESVGYGADARHADGYELSRDSALAPIIPCHVDGADSQVKPLELQQAIIGQRRDLGGNIEEDVLDEGEEDREELVRKANEKRYAHLGGIENVLFCSGKFYAKGRDLYIAPDGVCLIKAPPEYRSTHCLRFTGWPYDRSEGQCFQFWAEFGRIIGLNFALSLIHI